MLLMTIWLSGCGVTAGVDEVTPAACEVWAERKVAFPLEDAGRPVLEWATVTEAAMAEACR